MGENPIVYARKSDSETESYVHLDCAVVRAYVIIDDEPDEDDLESEGSDTCTICYFPLAKRPVAWVQPLRTPRGVRPPTTGKETDPAVLPPAKPPGKAIVHPAPPPRKPLVARRDSKRSGERVHVSPPVVKRGAVAIAYDPRKDKCLLAHNFCLTRSKWARKSYELIRDIAADIQLQSNCEICGEPLRAPA